MSDLSVIAVACLTSVPCAILGCFLVLRRMSLLGDAISHAVLPGLALAFLVTNSRNGFAMAIGAVVLGLITTFLTQSIHRLANVSEDASMGIVYTSLFSLGVILISVVAPRVDLDPGCVLYGSIENAIIDLPRFLGPLVPAFVVTLLFVVLFWKELKVISFDPALATAMGFNVSIIHYALMGMVATVTVVSFEAVGSILVIAMLIVPAATASLISRRLVNMVLWSIAAAIGSSVLGYYLSSGTNTSTAGMMAVASGILFGAAAIVSTIRVKLML